MLPENKNVTYLVGQMRNEDGVTPLTPYSDVVCDFLSDLSSELIHDKEAKVYPDVISFAFWCRRGNLMKLKDDFVEKKFRLGSGLVFHIAPSNVPINFAFSYVFSLLAGNANIVRVPSKSFPQIDIVCKVFVELFKNEKYKRINEMTSFVKYSHDAEITAYFSCICNCRVIWGGDDTINEIRGSRIPVRALDIAFADRYSFCVLDIDAIINSDKDYLKRVATGFYNDTYLMDQNACSSPHLIVWRGKQEQVEAAKKIFWKMVLEEVIDKYDLKPVNAVDKYNQLCRNAIDKEYIEKVQRYGNYIYCLDISELRENISELRGKFGYFFEYCTDDLSSLAHIVNTKFQTLTYFGIKKDELRDFVLKNNLKGIDRIVPIGTALDISVIWDGYDLIRMFSRVIDIS